MGLCSSITPVCAFSSLSVQPAKTLPAAALMQCMHHHITAVCQAICGHDKHGMVNAVEFCHTSVGDSSNMGRAHANACLTMSGLSRLLDMQTYKLESSITGARCIHNQPNQNRLLIAGIVAAGVLSLSMLLSAIMFFRSPAAT